MTSWVRTTTENDFSANASTGDRRIQVSLSGTADVTIRDQLDHFLREVHQEAQRRRAEEVTVDLRQLEFMNSSCLKCLVWWVSTVQEQPSEGKYRIVFVSSPSVYWQRRSLDALACLAGDIITIQT
jgi:anti-anti-sigma factor